MQAVKPTNQAICGRFLKYFFFKSRQYVRNPHIITKFLRIQKIAEARLYLQTVCGTFGQIKPFLVNIPAVCSGLAFSFRVPMGIRRQQGTFPNLSLLAVY